MVASADKRGWGPGWPTNNASKCITIRADRSGIKLVVRKEIAPVLKHCIDEVESRGYLFDLGPADVDDDWGFANRPVRLNGRNTKTPSNHSWGLAVDLDSQNYPQGQSKRRYPQWIVDVFAFFKFHNGVDFPTPDPMHFEFEGTPAEAAWLTAALAAHHIDATPPPVPTGTPTLQEVTFYARQQTLGAGYENPPQAVKILQGALNGWADRFAKMAGRPNPPDLAINGLWDQPTADAVKALQALTGLTNLEHGGVGPLTWAKVLS